MIDEILPPGVRSAEAFDDLAPAPLFPEEAALMAGRWERRQRQFATARACARRAQAELGLEPGPLLPGAGGAPRWPDGVVGSITHCDGYRAAVVARTTDVAALGIDAERAGPLPRGVLGLVASDGERAVVERLAAGRPGVPWDRLLFSAKEAVYKAWFPATGRWLGFADARVEPAADGTFEAWLHPEDPPAGAPTHYAGRWMVRGELLLTAVAPRAVRPARPLPARSPACPAGTTPAGTTQVSGPVRPYRPGRPAAAPTGTRRPS
ncbi:4'-phosphopantetheinyl transferase family protein [Streptomyces liangshanensis]|uniref:4'-phosphopantetheinyl transferase superfamily protein n=1 Tax=Streptomyces liangshanensis TaxID=2717324 RepID=A0A6G9GSD1_9ACTN|nr:4'-phosphopantetheinyl transferase superfamily protein [Streptomyces liangshanensis]QIQ01104.1 4'-phosphopantetheinyl transferase superfamily protein [Streptomyces liangshanensis]